MRFVVLGAGAVGGVVGGRLFQHGHDVVLVARGAHAAAIAADGLRVEDAQGHVTLRVPVVTDIADAKVGGGDVVLLAVKSQDTALAMASLTASSASDVPVVCLQNGVDNERTVLRSVPAVYAVVVMCPTTHLEPGAVVANSSPTTGILDIGRYPSGVDETAEAVAAAFRSATFESVARPDIMRWKYAKLLMNLGNAVQAACGPAAASSPVTKLARREAAACLRAAGIDVASAGEDRERRGDLLQMEPIAGKPRAGGSTWQSLARGTGSVETDHLNGEIVLLGRLHGVPTPVNEVLQRVARDLAARGAPPESMPIEELEAMLPPELLAAETGPRHDNRAQS